MKIKNIRFQVALFQILALPIIASVSLNAFASQNAENEDVLSLFKDSNINLDSKQNVDEYISFLKREKAEEKALKGLREVEGRLEKEIGNVSSLPTSPCKEVWATEKKLRTLSKQYVQRGKFILENFPDAFNFNPSEKDELSENIELLESHLLIPPPKDISYYTSHWKCSKTPTWATVVVVAGTLNIIDGLLKFQRGGRMGPNNGPIDQFLHIVLRGYWPGHSDNKFKGNWGYFEDDDTKKAK